MKRLSIIVPLAFLAIYVMERHTIPRIRFTPGLTLVLGAFLIFGIILYTVLRLREGGGKDDRPAWLETLTLRDVKHRISPQRQRRRSKIPLNIKYRNRTKKNRRFPGDRR